MSTSAKKSDSHNSLQTFQTITRQSHPAVPHIFAYLESIVHKDMPAFTASFGSRQAPFFANLPGAVKVTDIQRFLDMHKDFFASPISRFEYGELTHGVGGPDLFLCSVSAKVTLPNGSTRNVCIDMTFYKGHSTWLPGRFINTVIDSSQAVLH